jgi:hypothetical protein
MISKDSFQSISTQIWMLSALHSSLLCSSNCLKLVKEAIVVLNAMEVEYGIPIEQPQACKLFGMLHAAT